MSTPQKKRGLAELRDARRESRALYWFVGIFSFFVNLLMLTGPICMLQVYDRGDQNVDSMSHLYGMMGIGLCARADHGTRLDRCVFEAVLRNP